MRKSNGFEGVAAGTTLSTSNSGGAGQTAFDYVGIGSGGAITYDTSQFMHGSSSIKLLPGGSASLNVQYGGTGGQSFNATRLAARGYFRFSAAWTAGTPLISITNTSGARVCAIYAGADNKISVRDSSATLWSPASTLPANTWLRWEVYVEIGAAGTGKLKFAVYAGDSTTPLETYTNTTTANMGTAQIATCVFGNVNANASFTNPYWLDSPTVTDEVSDFLGPVVNAAPTITVSPVQNVAAGATVNLTATASDPDGSIASYAWTYVYPTSGGPAITGASTAGASLTAGAKGNLYILRCTVTDNQGATATATTEVRVPTDGALTTLPMDGTTTDAWTRTGGTTDGGTLADADDATLIESPVLVATATSERFRLTPSTPRDPLTFTPRQSKSDSGPAKTKLRLYDGTTLRQEWTLTDPTTSPADQTVTVTNPGAIADPGALWIEFVGSTS